MTEKQQEQIKYFTNESLTNCLTKLDSKFQSLKKELCDDLIQGIRLDVWDQLNGVIKVENQNTQNKIANHMGLHAIDEINNKKLKKDEYYVYDFQITLQTQNRSNSEEGVYFRHSIFTITNYSNVSWSKHVSWSKLGFSNIHQPTAPYSKKNIELNFRLHNIFIDILTTLKKIPFQNICGGDGNIDQGSIFNTFCDARYETLQEIVNLNKKYYMNLLVSSDLQRKYEKSLDDNKKLETENRKLKQEKEVVEQKLRYSIPVELQCCICFGYTDKSQFYLHGHSNLCSTCIHSVKDCPMCRSSIEKVQNIYK